MADYSILTPSDAEIMLAEGRLSPPDEKGFQRVHKRRLLESSSEDDPNIPSPAASYVHEDDGYAWIPSELISLATLEYIGLSAEGAASKWREWRAWSLGSPPISRENDENDSGALEMPFLDFATPELPSALDTISDDDDDWRECLRRHKVSKELEDAIMDPRFRFPRLTQSCAFWINDTFRMRYEELESIQSASRARAAQRQSGQGSASMHDRVSTSTHEQAPTSMRDQGTTQNGESNTERAHTNDPSLSVLAMSATSTPDTTVLYKGITEGRAKVFLNPDRSIHDLVSIASDPPGDFSGTRQSYYFTANFGVAKYYAGWAKRRIRATNAVIARGQVENSALENTDVLTLHWTSKEWKEMIWTCRRRQRLPDHLKKYQECTAVYGTAAKRPDSVYKAMDSYNNITARHVLRVSPDNVDATHWFFTEEKGADFLTENLKSIQIFPFTGRDMAEMPEQGADF